MNRQVSIEIPFPPSVNRLYRTFRGRVLLSKDGREWYARNLTLVQKQRAGAVFSGRLSVSLEIYPPDKRRRDVDNLLKVTFDVLTKAEVWVDDSLVDELYLKRFQVDYRPRIDVTIKEM